MIDAHIDDDHVSSCIISHRIGRCALGNDIGLRHADRRRLRIGGNALLVDAVIGAGNHHAALGLVRNGLSRDACIAHHHVFHFPEISHAQI